MYSLASYPGLPRTHTCFSSVGKAWVRGYVFPWAAALGNTYNCTKHTYNCTKRANPCTLEIHGTGDLYHNTTAVSFDKR